MEQGEWSRRYGLAIAVAVLGLIVLIDVLLPPSVVVSGSYAVAAVVAGALVTVRRTALIAVTCLVLSVVSGWWNQNFFSEDWFVRLLFTACLGVLGVVVARIRVQRERELEQMTVIAETAQRAVLRTMPTAVGSVGFAARYVSATEAALVGGDLYEVAETPYGVRLVVGDVRGKGLEAVQLAASVLGAFRRAVFAHPSLADVATDLDEVVRAIAGEEEFVTALLAEFHDDHSVTMVNCGHHPPMLVQGVRSSRLLDTGEPQPPLGLGPTPRPVTCACAPGSRLLLYTDGLVETRDAGGRFFPLTEHASELAVGSLDEALDVLVGDLAEFSGRRLQDDLVVVLAERLPAR